MTDKSSIIGNMRGAVTLLEQARDQINELYDDGEALLSWEDVEAIDTAIDQGRQLIKEVNFTATVYRDINVSRRGKGAPGKNARSNLVKKNKKIKYA